MINRLTSILHWATLAWAAFMAFDLFMLIVETGFQYMGSLFPFSLIEVMAIILGPLAVFYFLDFFIHGKITWLPWERDK